MDLGNALSQRQTEAQSAVGPRVGSITLGELAEDLRFLVLGQADALVGN